MLRLRPPLLQPLQLLIIKQHQQYLLRHHHHRSKPHHHKQIQLVNNQPHKLLNRNHNLKHLVVNQLRTHPMRQTLLIKQARAVQCRHLRHHHHHPPRIPTIIRLFIIIRLIIWLHKCNRTVHKTLCCRLKRNNRQRKCIQHSMLTA